LHVVDCETLVRVSFDRIESSLGHGLGTDCSGLVVPTLVEPDVDHLVESDVPAVAVPFDWGLAVT
jgi:hypothetical protein